MKRILTLHKVQIYLNSKDSFDNFFTYLISGISGRCDPVAGLHLGRNEHQEVDNVH